MTPHLVSPPPTDLLRPPSRLTSTVSYSPVLHYNATMRDWLDEARTLWICQDILVEDFYPDLGKGDLIWIAVTHVRVPNAFRCIVSAQSGTILPGSHGMYELKVGRRFVTAYFRFLDWLRTCDCCKDCKPFYGWIDVQR